MVELEQTTEAPFIKNSLIAKAKELRVAADHNHHRMLHNPHLRDGFEYLIRAYDDAAGILEDRAKEILEKQR